jgi:hypothetical protein
MRLIRNNNIDFLNINFFLSCQYDPVESLNQSRQILPNFGNVDSFFEVDTYHHLNLGKDLDWYLLTDLPAYISNIKRTITVKVDERKKHQKCSHSLSNLIKISQKHFFLSWCIYYLSKNGSSSFFKVKTKLFC